MTLPACNYLNFESSNLNSSNQKMKSIGYFERSSTFFALHVETHVGYIDEAASISHGTVMRRLNLRIDGRLMYQNDSCSRYPGKQL